MKDLDKTTFGWVIGLLVLAFLAGAYMGWYWLTWGEEEPPGDETAVTQETPPRVNASNNVGGGASPVSIEPETATPEAEPTPAPEPTEGPGPTSETGTATPEPVAEAEPAPTATPDPVAEEEPPEARYQEGDHVRYYLHSGEVAEGSIQDVAWSALDNAYLYTISLDGYRDVLWWNIREDDIVGETEFIPKATPDPPPAPVYVPIPIYIEDSSGTPEPTQPPPANAPLRQFNTDDLVRWVSGGGWVQQGTVDTYHLDEVSGRWVYNIEREDGSIWHSLEENRLTLVVESISPPYQRRLPGLPVMYFDYQTGEYLGEGIVQRVVKQPDFWAYDVLQADCTVELMSKAVEIPSSLPVC